VSERSEHPIQPAEEPSIPATIPATVPAVETGVPPPASPNPYALVMAEVAQQSLEVPAAAPLPPAAPPRIWSALLVGILTMPLAGLLSTIVMLVVLSLEYGNVPRTREALQPMIEQFATTKLGIFLMIAPGQVVFLAVALAAALASPVAWRQRLHLTWGRFPKWRWSWPVLALGTPMVGFISSIIVSQMVDAKSENLVMLQKVFRDQQGPFVLVLYLIVGVLPGVAEEFLFRGYVQTRLLQRLPAWVAIGVTSAMFAIAHFDPIHVVSVFPLGVWLGILAWRTGSIWPSVLAHAANNCLAIAMTRWGEVDLNNQADLVQRAMVLMTCGYTMLIAIMLLVAMRAPKAAVAHV